jgi:hypothetical protein
MDGIDDRHTAPGLGWQVLAACAGTDDPDLFFPDRSDYPVEALAICQGCPVRRACRSHAFDQPERVGVWGGLTEREREDLLRPRLVQPQARRPSAWVGLRLRRLGA